VIFARAKAKNAVEFFVAPGRADKQMVSRTWGKRLAELYRPLEAIDLG
jgi:hypothetical protein